MKRCIIFLLFGKAGKKHNLMAGEKVSNKKPKVPTGKTPKESDCGLYRGLV
jgi:hypothetical protein